MLFEQVEHVLDDLAPFGWRLCCPLLLSVGSAFVGSVYIRVDSRGDSCNLLAR